MIELLQGNKSGSASLMKSVENYLQNQIKQLSLQDLLVINRNISLSNIGKEYNSFLFNSFVTEAVMEAAVAPQINGLVSI